MQYSIFCLNLTMYQFFTKFRLVFLPYLLIATATIGLYTFLNWLILIKLQLFKIPDQVVNIFVPVVLPLIPVLIWLRPRIKLLNLKKSGKSDPVAGILYLNWISIAIPLSIAQFYLVTATGKLTTLNKISEINYSPPTKYYSVKQFYGNQNMAHIKIVYNVSGKNRSDFNMNIYVVVPVFDHLFPDTNQVAIIRNTHPKALIFINNVLSNMQLLKKMPTDSIRLMQYLNPSIVMLRYGEAGRDGAIFAFTKSYKMKKEPAPMKISPIVWLAVKYSSTISNALSLTQKNEYCKSFFENCRNELMHKSLSNFTYLARLPYNNEITYYTAAIESRGDVADDNPIILSPIYEKFADRNGNRLTLILGGFGLGSIIFLIILSLVKLRKVSISEIDL